MFFDAIHTLDDLKAAYRKLAMQHHPDMGGDTETMQRINAEYTQMHDALRDAHNAAADDYHKTTETAAEFIDIISALLRLSGLRIELCGSWLWIGGDTRTHKDALKALGCRWSKQKSLWYWHHAEGGHRWYRGRSSMADIRTKYGSQTFGARGDEMVGA